MQLAERLRQKRAEKPILLMTHIVIGYPDLQTSLELVDAMVEAGVDAMELQIPFSEPMADGPVILKANQAALRNGTSVDACFEFAERVTRRHDIPFLFMSYYNVLYRRGLARFAADARKAGILGAIVPDCPPEEATEYLAAMQQSELAPVFIFSPNTSDARMRTLGTTSGGFVYVVARKGVTGAETQFEADLAKYLERCRRATDLPLAVGFGLKSREDVEFLKGKVDIAVIGSQSLRVLDEQGVAGVKSFLSNLR